LNLINEIIYDEEYKKDIESLSKMEDYSGREEIWQDESEPAVFIEWIVRDGGEAVDYYAYIQTREDGDISNAEAITWWETSLKN